MQNVFQYILDSYECNYEVTKFDQKCNLVAVVADKLSALVLLNRFFEVYLHQRINIFQKELICG